MNNKEIKQMVISYQGYKNLGRMKASQRRSYWLEEIRHRTPYGGMLVQDKCGAKITKDILWLEQKGKIKRIRPQKGGISNNHVRCTRYVVVDMNVKL